MNKESRKRSGESFQKSVPGACKEKVWEVIIVGSGAAGLFAGASMPLPASGGRLFLEKMPFSGKKLLLAGAGQCNLTHDGSIKNFLSHYGDQGKAIRSILYQFNNEALIRFFESRGLAILSREDGKVFPRSFKSQDVLNLLISQCKKNGFDFQHSQPVTALRKTETGFELITKEKRYSTKYVIVATGGCSYPSTGSDGNFFPILDALSLKILPPLPALTSLFVKAYPFAELAGISFPQAIVTIHGKKNEGGLLLTHNCFSGPSILHSSRYACAGDLLTINYTGKPQDNLSRLLYHDASGYSKGLSNYLQEQLTKHFPSSGISGRFLDALCRKLSYVPGEKASHFSLSDFKKLADLLTCDTYTVDKLGGFSSAMVTKGGVSLDEIHMKTMETLKYPGLFIVGETLDVDGDTGGYNLQFAFSSGYLAAKSLSLR